VHYEATELWNELLMWWKHTRDGPLKQGLVVGREIPYFEPTYRKVYLTVATSCVVIVHSSEPRGSYFIVCK
jgi:hypothetical protein